MLSMTLGGAIKAALIALLLATGGVAAAMHYYSTPGPGGLGYMPRQPVAFNHVHHVGTLGLDCRYCHTYGEVSPVAGIPPAVICLSCHNKVLPDDPRLALVRKSAASGEAVPWVSVHVLGDDVTFNHDAHVGVGTACETCHGRVDQMLEIRQTAPLTEAWCLECHREPERFLRPRQAVFEVGYVGTGDPLATGREIKQEFRVRPPLHCSGCHQ